MPARSTPALLALTFACATLGPSAWAQTSTAPATSTKAPAKASSKKKKPAPAKKEQPETPLAPADETQLEAFKRVFLGSYQCEFKQRVEVKANPKYEGYADIIYGKTTFVTKPVVSYTGAIRLEDVKGIGLMVQIAAKSMLLDVKTGERLVDDCFTEAQAEAHEEWLHPHASEFDLDGKSPPPPALPASAPTTYLPPPAMPTAPAEATFPVSPPLPASAPATQEMPVHPGVPASAPMEMR